MHSSTTAVQQQYESSTIVLYGCVIPHGEIARTHILPLQLYDVLAFIPGRWYLVRRRYGLSEKPALPEESG